MSANETLPDEPVTQLFEESEIANARSTAETVDQAQTPSPDLHLGKDEEAIKNQNGVALALGGGVARGWSHIGVLRALDEANIPISMIAGTSIGAVVGGCYLAGKLDELEEFARSITRRNILRYVDFTLGKSGFIAGNRLAERLDDELGDIRIEDLSKRFVAVATEINTGHEVWLEHGKLAPAIRASYALPGIFEPVTHMSKHLVDGALVNPVPVSACRAMGAHIVIAVSLNGDAFGPIGSSHEFDLDGNDDDDDGIDPFSLATQSLNKLRPDRLLLKSMMGSGQSGKGPKLGGVMMGTLNIVMDRISRSRLAGDPPDVFIAPRIGHIGMLEFTKADELIERGYRAMQHEIPLIHSVIETLTHLPGGTQPSNG